MSVTQFDPKDPLDYPGVPKTSLDARWNAAITLVEMVLRHFELDALPVDNPDLLDVVLDHIDVVLDQLGLHFVSDLVGEEVDALAG